MADTDRRSYFAYGSNIDQAQMAQRCRKGAVLLGIARLYGYRFIINARGVATVVPQSCGEVCGVLWGITQACERALDVYEGVGRGTYRKMVVDVVFAGRTPPALIYVASESTPGSPTDDYMRRIVSAAEYHGLPPEYVEELRTWSKTND